MISHAVYDLRAQVERQQLGKDEFIRTPRSGRIINTWYWGIAWRLGYIYLFRVIACEVSYIKMNCVVLGWQKVVSFSFPSMVSLRRAWKTLLVPVDAGLHALHPKTLDQVWADDVLPELFLLQQLKVLQGRSRVGKILEVRWAAPVLEIVEIGDKGRIAE